LKDLFREKVGDIMFCEVFEKDGKSLGSAAMEFRTIADAERAVEIMHHYELDGRKISVRLDNEGYKTKQAKEAANSNNRNDSNKNSSINNGLFLNDTNSQAAAIALALNSLNPSGLLNSNGGQNSLLSNLGNILQLNNPLASNLVTSSLMSGANPSVQHNSMLNMIASQLKVEGPVTNRLFVASLDYKVNEEKIKEVFGLAGVVQSVSLFKDKDGRSRGMAVVEYDSPLEALNAVSMFNHQQLMDRQMTVRFDTKPPKDDDINKSSTSSSQSKLPAGLKSIGTGLTNLLPKSGSSFSANINQIGGLSNLSNMNPSNDLTPGISLNLNGSGLGK
jgi:RNA recognition motif-containing protein